MTRLHPFVIVFEAVCFIHMKVLRTSICSRIRIGEKCVHNIWQISTNTLKRSRFECRQMWTLSRPYTNARQPHQNWSLWCHISERRQQITDGWKWKRKNLKNAVVFFIVARKTEYFGKMLTFLCQSLTNGKYSTFHAHCGRDKFNSITYAHTR